MTKTVVDAQCNNPHSPLEACLDSWTAFNFYYPKEMDWLFPTLFFRCCGVRVYKGVAVVKWRQCGSVRAEPGNREMLQPICSRYPPRNHDSWQMWLFFHVDYFLLLWHSTEAPVCLVMGKESRGGETRRLIQVRGIHFGKHLLRCVRGSLNKSMNFLDPELQEAFY